MLHVALGISHIWLVLWPVGIKSKQEVHMKAVGLLLEDTTCYNIIKISFFMSLDISEQL